MQPTDLLSKQQQFSAAMKRYNGSSVYGRFSTAVALANVSLQAILLIQVVPLLGDVTPLGLVVILGLALYLTDLVNGFIHMLMDNYGYYSNLAGPLVANFHLHHKTPLYKKRPLPIVYFVESGAKVWLVGYLAGVLLLLELLPAFVAISLVLIGVLSSVAEVSHYLCHTSRSPFVKTLMQVGLLLSKKHHAKHHTEDNRNYAFLNGWSDPVLNWVAKQLFSGYKRGTDQHYASYQPGSEQQFKGR